MANHVEAGLWAGAEAQRLLLLRKPAAAAEANDRARAIAPRDFGLHVQRVWIRVQLQELDRARAAFREASDLTRSADDLDQLFKLVPILFAGWPRTRHWLRLQDRLAQMEAENHENGATTALVLRMRLALKDHEGFLDRLKRTPIDPADAMLGELRRIGAVLGSTRFPDFDRPKVFGIGLSKTGTTSLNRALDLLGFHAMHFTNRLTHEILKIEDAFLFDALTDTPVAAAFETLYHMFPGSKFIYTTREPSAWQDSFAEHHERQHGTPALETLGDLLSTHRAAGRGQERAAIHANLYGGHADALAARQAFERRVQSFFAAHDASRLLCMDICGGEGWDRLCAFLDRPIPSQDFPWENKTPLLPSSQRYPEAVDTPISADPLPKPWTIVDQANDCLTRHELAAAEALLLECRTEFPAYGPAAAALAHLRGIQKRQEESRAAWRALVRDYGGALEPWWLVELARAERLAGDPREAERLLDRCLDLFSEYAPAAAARAELLTGLGRPDDAYTAWHAALRDFPAAAQPWWFLSAAAALCALGREKEAEAHLDRMESRFPEARETLARRARTAVAAEQWAKALECWDACLRTEGAGHAPEYLSSRALALFRLGRIQEALDAWSALVSQADDFTPAFVAYAAAMGELGRWDDARALYTRMIERDPQRAPAEWWVERLRARLQDRRQAVRAADIDDVLSRFPQSPQAHMLHVEFCFAHSLGARAIAAALQAGLHETTGNRWLLAEQVRILLAQGAFDEARALAADLAADNDDHYAEISRWRIVADTKGGGGLAAVAEAALARHWPMESGLVLADFLLAQFAPWADVLAGRLSEHVFQSFPGRPRIICLHARALIALRQDAAAAEIIASLPDLCVTTEALELRAWAAARVGDLARTSRIWREILAQAWFASLHSAAPILQRLTPSGAVDEIEGITAFSNVCNEMPNLPAFLRHHRRLGVSRFVIVDHGSRDGGTDFLRAQPDVILYRTDDGFQQSGAGMRWVNWLRARHAESEWQLELDADEAFVYPGWETTPLPRFVAWLEKEGAQAVASFMLDLYPRRLLGPDGETTPLEAYRHYDPPAGWAGITRPPWLQPYGGARARLLQVPEVLQKISLVRRGAGDWLSSHATTPMRLSTVSGLLLHYKLFNLARRWSATATTIDSYMADRTPDLMRRHNRYATCMKDLLDRDLTEEGVSSDLADSLTLADRGLMRAPDDYRRWIACLNPKKE